METHTLVTDLGRDLEAIRSELSKTTRYEINRAGEKDGLVYRYWKNPGDDLCDRFCAFFEEFAFVRGIQATTRHRLRTYSRAGALVLTEVVSSENVTLTWHAYLCTKGRTRLLHSASRRLSGDSEFRKLVSRANRYHHWQDFSGFKAEGVTTYDWGGIYLGGDDAEKIKITEFKQGFGGKPETLYNCELPLSLKGRAYYFLRNRYYQLRARR